jgi:hypothetical protein
MRKATWKEVLSESGSDSDSSTGSKSSPKRTLTSKSGKSKLTIHVDAAVRNSVKAVIGEDANLSVVENGYTSWGSHRIIRQLSKATTGQYILSKGEEYNGWVFTNVDSAELHSKLKKICKEAAPNWKFKIKCKQRTGIKLSKAALKSLEDSNSEDSSSEDSDSDSDSKPTPVKTKAAGKKSVKEKAGGKKRHLVHRRRGGGRGGFDAGCRRRARQARHQEAAPPRGRGGRGGVSAESGGRDL